MSDDQVTELINRIESMARPLQWGWKILVAVVAATAVVTMGYSQMSNRVGSLEVTVKEQTAINKELSRAITGLNRTIDRLDERVNERTHQ